MVKKFMRRYLQGRITDPALWQKKLEKICKKWLLNTPTLSSSDSGRKKRKKSIQVWQTGTLLLALREAGTPETLLKQASTKIHKEFDTDCITDADYGLLCFALDGIPEFEPLQKAMLNYAKENRMENGAIRYKSAVCNLAFVDTLGFVCPFLSQYGLSHDQPELVELAKEQINLYLGNGTETHTGLPFHAYRTEDSVPLGICDWARGLAWLLIALMDSYLCLLKADKKDDFYAETIARYADLLLKLQKQSGGYSWQLLLSRDTDSSATAVFGWFLACAYELFGRPEYLTAAQNCRKYLQSVTFSDGSIDFCQGDTISIGVYSRSFWKMPFAQGFALRLQTRLKQYDN